ncbi:hypothetical protein [Xanthomonas fragariae]|uniref:hypothetical protein n=1 Tax=Xanthomonas fragariae TaxID=48664 RepID=UPI001F47D3FD|nr:hypothetical protein [Xanthomonas fragariae]
MRTTATARGVIGDAPSFPAGCVAICLHRGQGHGDQQGNRTAQYRLVIGRCATQNWETSGVASDSQLNTSIH